MVTWTVSIPGSGARASLTRRWISAFRGQPATVRRMATTTRPSLTSHVADHAEVDDAAVELGVVDVAEGRQHGVAGGRRAHMNIRA